MMFEYILDVVAIDAFNYILLDNLKVTNRTEFECIVIHGGQPDMNVIDVLGIAPDFEAEAILAANQMLGACHDDELVTTELLKDRLGNGQIGHFALHFL